MRSLGRSPVWTGVRVVASSRVNHGRREPLVGRPAAVGASAGPWPSTSRATAPVRAAMASQPSVGPVASTRVAGTETCSSAATVARLAVATSTALRTNVRRVTPCSPSLPKQLQDTFSGKPRARAITAR